MEFPDESGGVTRVSEDISEIHLVAFQRDIEVGKPLILFSSNILDVKFAIRIARETTGQKAVP